MMRFTVALRMTNDQWLPLLTSPSDVETTFKSMKQAGIKVLRTWVYNSHGAGIVKCILSPVVVQGFNAINGTELEGALQTNLTYYQVNHNPIPVANSADLHSGMEWDAVPP